MIYSYTLLIVSSINTNIVKVHFNPHHNEYCSGLSEVVLHTDYHIPVKVRLWNLDHYNCSKFVNASLKLIIF